MEERLKPFESYIIVSDSGCRISYIDAAGVSHLQLTVPPHEEKRFTCLSPRTTISDDNALVVPVPTISGGDSETIQDAVKEALHAVVTPVELLPDTVLQNGQVYTHDLVAAVSFAGLSVADACSSAELWINAGNEVPVITWPDEWCWIESDNDQPTTPAPNKLNCYVVRRDSAGVVINLAYCH